MATMNISLPDGLREYVEERVAEGGYSTASEYVQDLIREDQKRKGLEKLEALLLEGLDSPSREMTPKDWAEIRRELNERLAEKARLPTS